MLLSSTSGAIWSTRLVAGGGSQSISSVVSQLLEGLRPHAMINLMGRGRGEAARFRRLINTSSQTFDKQTSSFRRSFKTLNSGLGGQQQASKHQIIKIDKKLLTVKPASPQPKQPQPSPPPPPPPPPPPSPNGEVGKSGGAAAGTISIFKRFKEAYKQHGKILIATHMVTSVGWISGLFMLAKGGFDITSLFGVLEKLHVMSRETGEAFAAKIEHFRLEDFLRRSYFNYVLTEPAIVWLGSVVTGLTLKYMITAAVLYKLVTPFRYLLTIGATNLVIRLFKRRGVIPQQPPAGSSIRELYTEQKYVLRRSLKTQREKYRKRFLSPPKR